MFLKVLLLLKFGDHFNNFAIHWVEDNGVDFNNNCSFPISTLLQLKCLLNAWTQQSRYGLSSCIAMFFLRTLRFFLVKLYCWKVRRLSLFMYLWKITILYSFDSRRVCCLSNRKKFGEINSTSSKKFKNFHSLFHID